MPKIRIELVSKRNRQIPDPLNAFIFEGDRTGVLRNNRGIEPTSKRLTIDAAPDVYSLHIEIDGFHDCRKQIRVPLPKAKSVGVIPVPIPVTHRCTDLPTWSELKNWQRSLIASLAPKRKPAEIWNTLSDNQCATFFQITYALMQKRLANGRTLASYVNALRAIGGVRIVGTSPEGKKKTATGWRLHATINAPDRQHIRHDLEEKLDGKNTFNKDSYSHPTHKKFGFVQSYRERGALPRLQVVLNKNNSAADLDLDVAFHRSAPHVAYGDFKEKFPGACSIYKVT